MNILQHSNEGTYIGFASSDRDKEGIVRKPRRITLRYQIICADTQETAQHDAHNPTTSTKTHGASKLKVWKRTVIVAEREVAGPGRVALDCGDGPVFMMHGAIKLHDNLITRSKNSWSDLVHQPQFGDSRKRVER